MAYISFLYLVAIFINANYTNKCSAANKFNNLIKIV